jgi:cell division protein FtsB
MATARQIQYRIGQAKKKFTKLNKEVAAVKNKMKGLEAQLKKAKAAEKARPKAKKRPARKRAAKKR